MGAEEPGPAADWPTATERAAVARVACVDVPGVCPGPDPVGGCVAVWSVSGRVTLSAALDAVQDGLDLLAAVDLDQACEEELAAAVLRLQSFAARLTALDGRVVGRFDAGQHWADEARSMRGWLRRHGRAGEGDLARRQRLPRLLVAHPVMAEHLTAGRITLEHLQTLARVHRAVPALRAELDAVEDVIADYATGVTPSELHHFLAHLVATVAPDAVDDKLDKDLQDRAHLSVHEYPDGWVAVSALLPPELGGRLLSALRALMAPPEADDPAPDPAAEPPDRDRPRSSRMLDALHRLLAYAAAGQVDGQRFPTHRGGRPEIVVTVDADTLLAGQTRTDRPAATMLTPAGRAPVPVTLATVQWLACDATVRRLLLDPESIPVDVGRTTRTIPTGLLTVITSRDCHCRWPGCRDRIDHGHHLLHWSSGGSTRSDNLIGLCWWHHQQAHLPHWTVHGDANRDVRFSDTRPGGSTHTTAPPRSHQLTTALQRLRT